MQGVPKLLGLPRERRMAQKREFVQVQKMGKRAVNGCLIANWMVLPDQQTSKLGVITSRKVGPAVVRSRARRLLRESFRLHQRELCQPLMLVLVARPSIASKNFHAVERDLIKVLKQHQLLKSAE